MKIQKHNYKLIVRSNKKLVTIQPMINTEVINLVVFMKIVKKIGHTRVG